jgi:histone deacetylase 6
MDELESKSVYANEHSTEAAYLSCGASLAATEAVLNGTVQNALVIARPPGHHAEACQCMGFCMFNNVAVAAACAIEKWNVKKILILDWDVHHGNGTQHMFEDNPNVMYVSLHRYEQGTFYPCSRDGSPLKTGSDGTNLNIGWNTGWKTDEDYAYAFEHCVMPACREFAPDLVYISAGFDAARGDPLGGCDVSPLGYGYMTKELVSLAEGKVIIVLEGGYNLQSIAASTLGCLNVLLGGDPPPLETQRAKEKDDAEKDGRDSDNSDREDTVQSVLNTIQAHHALLEHHCNAPKWPIEEMKRLGLN